MIAGARQWALIAALLFGGAALIYHGAQESAQREDERETWLANLALQACAPWKGRGPSETDCDLAFHAWWQCRRYLSRREAQGVLCEHPRYRFETRWQLTLRKAWAEANRNVNP